MNRTIRVYPAFAEFYGMEETIERIVGFFRHAAQGLEERKQILYLLGPGRRRQVLARRAAQGADGDAADLCAEGRRRDQPGLREPARPVRSGDAWAPMLEERYGIPRRRLTGLMSPWCVKRLDEFGGDISQVHASSSCTPSRLRQIGIAKTEPGDENNQDISSLVGKVDIRKLEMLSPERPGRLQLFRRAQPRQPGPARIRRDVQGADQDAAPAADRDAGGQLRRHREHRRDPVPAASSWRTRTRPSGRPSRTTRTTRPSSTASTSSRCRTACASTEEQQDLREAGPQLASSPSAPCAPAHAGDAGALLRAVAAEARTRTPTLYLQDAGL